ncbi:MAG: hypothetical protein SF187_05970 [Deltaproteobacteria bacterium]|nr:hypothetical protein [Deltaproteobacteria bacterium]
MKTTNRFYVASVVLGYSLAMACAGSSGGTDDNKGGNAGEPENNGGSGGKTGTGGASTAGTAGKAAGGSGGSNTGGGTTGGSGGSPIGGMTTGGSAGTPPEPKPYSANLPDCVENMSLETCLHREPKCWFRPDWPNMEHCGPKDAAPLLQNPQLKTTGFCGEKYVQDGIFGTKEGDNTTIPKGAMIPLAYAEPLTAGGTITTDLPQGVGRVYLPGGPDGYKAAAENKVALSIWTDVLGSASNSRFKIENVHEFLVKKNEIPYTIAVFLPDDLNAQERVPQLRTIIAALQAKWPKISNDPNYRVIAGQSTAGANAFDTMWMGSDVVSRGIGGSPSQVCFTCLGKDWCPSTDPGCAIKNTRYQRTIAFCPARNVRWSATVGTCDIFGSVGERTAAGCGSSAGKGSVDASGCGANWLKTNIEVAQALKAKNMHHQLFVIDKGIHLDEVWTATALPHQLRWIFKDLTCAN